MKKSMPESHGLPCGECKGLCCGPVPVTKQEFLDIKKTVRQMPKQYCQDIKNQLRYYGTCIFLDLDENKCIVYSVRPAICKAFGNYKNMPCFRKPDAASDKSFIVKEKPIGLLSVDFSWKDFI